MIRQRVQWRAEDVLGGFFAEQHRLATGSRSQRLLTAEADLRACLEAVAAGLLDPNEHALVALEHEFHPDGAVARVALAADLLTVIPVWLDDPRWHGEEQADRMLRIRLAEPLMEWIVRLPGIGDVGRAAWRVDAAVRHETWLLRQERESARRDAA
ncbi:hypothetical protein [Amnibacterium endophyticum]|uniref:Uncharacterized protein n=1 Tax=Amnibacterium endophyticum TaxID=2109337 RepID=A0ABW4LHV4_9MICO